MKLSLACFAPVIFANLGLSWSWHETCLLSSMKLQNIQSKKVRAILTMSATPASDLQGLDLDGKLSESERDEAYEYFARYGGLKAMATAERITNGI